MGKTQLEEELEQAQLRLHATGDVAEYSRMVAVALESYHARNPDWLRDQRVLFGVKA